MTSKPYSKNFATEAEYHRHYRASNKERLHQQRLEWKARNPDKIAKLNRDSSLRRYKITQERYDELLALQQGTCGICGTTDPGRSKDKYFCIDHDHATNTIRGLLCARCNLGIGYLQDDLRILSNAITYLQQAYRPTAGESSVPRGVYDRSKTKEQREAEKAGKNKAANAPKKVAKAAAPKASPKKTAAVKATKAPSTETIVHSQAPQVENLPVEIKISIVADNIAALSGAINHLSSTSVDTDLVGQLHNELRANTSILTTLRQQVFGLADFELKTSVEDPAPEVTEDDSSDQETVAPAQAPQAYVATGTIPLPPTALPPQPTGFPHQS